MDLYSIARRLAEPFVFSEAEGPSPDLPLAARGVIGDGHSVALVRVDGAIDWLCWPRFDSPSVFGGLLDPDQGGTTWVRPTARPFESLQQYDPGTNVLETLFRVPGQGVLRLTDYMPWTDDPRATVHEVHRRIECLDGSVPVHVLFDPRFDYGRGTTTIDIQRYGVLARGPGGERIAAIMREDEEWCRAERGGAEARLTLKTGERRWMVVSWDAAAVEPLSVYRPFQHLRATRYFWREWVRNVRYDGPWRHHVLRSALVLKMLIYGSTGAMVAAPTTSLPEWIGGVRNWDYRYHWTRDTAMGIRAANLVGCVTEAREFFHFVRDTLDRKARLDIMYAVDGTPVPDEEVLHHLDGFQGSKPVRIGNGARDQVQLDTAGALLDAAYLYEQHEGALSLRAWRGLRDVVESVSNHWAEPDHGIWEPRGQKRHNVHSRLMSWLALDRGAQLAAVFGETDHEKRWAKSAEDVRADIRANGLDPTRSHFVTAYGYPKPDASLLLMSIHGFLEGSHPLLDETVRWLRSELGDGSFIHRYRMEDGVGGPEGAFVLCGFWLAEALALAGRIDEAQEVFVAHADASNHLGLLAEEIDPSSKTLLGNFPQAFSHLGLINAAARIDWVLRMRDEGSRRGARLGRRESLPQV